MSDVWVQPTGGALGADIHGVDLSKPVGDTAFARILQAWNDHLVAVARSNVVQIDRLSRKLSVVRRCVAIVV